MASTEERFSQWPSPVSASFSNAADVRGRALGRLLRGMRRARAVGLLVGLIVLWSLLVVDAVKWSSTTMLVATAIYLPVAIFDIVRLLRVRDEVSDRAALDILLIGLVQIAVIVVTGGIESPFLPVVIPLSLVGGVLIEGRVARIALLLMVWSGIAVFAAGGVFSWWPRTSPPFLQLNPGYAEQPRFVIAVALTLMLICTVAINVGHLVSNAVDRMLEEVSDARQATFVTLADRNRELVELSSTIAHELKNPLASVQGLVQLIERGGKNSEKRFEVLNRELLRTRTVLDEFLNFSRPLGELTVAEVDVPELFMHLAAFHEGMAAGREVRIAPYKGRRVCVVADPRKLGQALTNLLMNALEASSPRTSVHWILSEDRDTMCIGVQDEGPGMTESLLARATDVGATTKPHGSGIGLAVARTIAEQHGGRLRLENREGGLWAALEIPRESGASA